MTKRLLIILASLALLLGVAAPASAADNVPESGSCKLSANWTVLLSSNWDGTFVNSGGLKVGTLDYFVISSPGHLASISWTISRSNPDGTATGADLSPTNTPTSGRFVDRYDPNTTRAWDLLVHVVAPSGIGCTAQAHLSLP